MDFPVELSQEVLEKAAKLKIEPRDIVEKFVRGSGAGGQKINKTASTVWLKHLPTGVEVKVQKHRERSLNRRSAYKLLVNKIEGLVFGKKSEAAQKAFKIRKQKKRRTRKAKDKMVDSKVKRGELKKLRGKVPL